MSKWWSSGQIYNNLHFVLVQRDGSQELSRSLSEPVNRRVLFRVLDEGANAKTFSEGLAHLYRELKTLCELGQLPYSFEQLWASLLPILRSNHQRMGQEQQPSQQQAQAPQRTQQAAHTRQSQAVPGTGTFHQQRRVKGSQTKYYTGNYPRVERIGTPTADQEVPGSQSSRFVPGAPSTGAFPHMRQPTGQFPRIGSNQSTQAPRPRQPTGQYPLMGVSQPGAERSRPRRQFTGQMPHMGSSHPAQPLRNPYVPTNTSHTHQPQQAPRQSAPQPAPQQPNHAQIAGGQDISKQTSPPMSRQILTQSLPTRSEPWWSTRRVIDLLRLELLNEPDANLMLHYLKQPENAERLTQALFEAARLPRKDEALRELSHWFIYATYEKRLQWSVPRFWAVLSGILRVEMAKQANASQHRPEHAR
jgi:hypothetical protein